MLISYHKLLSSFKPGVLLIIVVTFSPKVLAQADEQLTIKSEEPIMEAVERLKPRPKFIELEFQTLNNFAIEALSEEFGNASAQVNQNLIRNAKLKFPVILKDDINLIGGFGYRHEQFRFSRLSEPDYALFERFENKPLKQISSSFYLKKKLKNDRFYFAFLNSSLNSDEPQFENFFDQLKSSVAFIYGKQVNPNKEVGYGLSFGYDLGQPTVFPLFIYNNDFNLHWGLELLLPKSVKLRYSPSDQWHFYATSELKGASYHLQDEVLEGYDQLEFRRSSVRPSLTAEREIHDWLWIGGTIGYRIPINIFISEPGENRRNSIIEIEAESAFYFNFSLFIVPPSKLYDRAKSG
ncbi:MAG: DUF6268 family outer membrane beta-barrel protein [Bacteroidota bacterium]